MSRAGRQAEWQIRCSKRGPRKRIMVSKRVFSASRMERGQTPMT